MTISYNEENSKDCSLGFCTIYCPQLCYPLNFPPSPSFTLTTNFHNHFPSFSPLLITIITFLATFSLLITYHKLISNFCRSFYSRRHLANPNDNFEEEEEEESGSEEFHEESWHLPPSTGLDEAFIRKITTCRYKRGEGLVEGTECSVCLSEFIEDESLRLLPKCSHAFHVQCIDTWLKSHSNCPLCRVNIMLPSLDDDVVIVVGDLERAGDEVKVAQYDLYRSSRRGRRERGKVGSCRRSLHAVMSPVRMKRSVFGGRFWFVRRGRGRTLLLLPVC